MGGVIRGLDNPKVHVEISGGIQKKTCPVG